MKKVRALCSGVSICIALSVHAAYAVAPPEELHYVQVGSFGADGKAKADVLAEHIRAQGWAPVQVIDADDGTRMPVKVRFGQFETYPDADWWKRAMQRRGHEGAFIVSEPNSTSSDGKAPAGPLEPNFAKVTQFDSEHKGRIQAVRAERFSHLADQFDLLLSEQPERIATDTTRTKEIINALQVIADGKLSASKVEVCQARIAIAHATHYGRLRWLTAYHMYGEAQQLAEPGSAEEAECLLQRAAMLMELSKSGKGSLAECRRLCKLIEERVPKRFERVHSVAALIHAESLFDEGKDEESQPEFMAIVHKWPTRQREIVAAQIYAGTASARMKRYDEARALLTQVVELKFDVEKFFGWRGKIQDPVLDALDWLIYIAEQTGNTSDAEAWKTKSSALKEQHGDRLLIRGKE